MIANKLASLFGLNNFGRVAPDMPQRYIGWLPVQNLPENLQLNMDSALQVSVVWACVDAIAKAIASCDWGVFVSEKSRRKFLPDDALDYVLNVRANPEMTAIGFREALLYASLTWGNGYAEIVPDGRGAVAELWPLVPQRMQMLRDPQTLELYYQYMQWDGGLVKLPPSRVLHIRGPSINGLLGENIVARAIKSIALAVAAERFSVSFFGNSTVVGGILEFPRTLDQKSYDRLKKDWEEKRQGPENAHKPIILEGGAKFTNTVVNPQESQLIDSRKFQIEEICRWYGVPPHKVQHLDRATFNNIEHLGLEFVRDALTPWALRLEQEANYKLFPMRSKKRTKIDMAWLSQGDFKSRADGYAVLRNIGVMSANDILRAERMNEIGPEGDLRIVGSNMQLLDTLKDRDKASLEKLKTPPAPLIDRADLGEESDDGEEGEDETKIDSEDNPGAKDVLRESIVALFASTVERYAKRIANRERDLRRRSLPPAQIEGNVAAERSKLRPWLLAECRDAMDILGRVGKTPSESEVLILADTVDTGAPPRAVAEAFVTQHLTSR